MQRPVRNTLGLLLKAEYFHDYRDAERHGLNADRREFDERIVPSRPQTSFLPHGDLVRLSAIFAAFGSYRQPGMARRSDELSTPTVGPDGKRLFLDLAILVQTEGERTRRNCQSGLRRRHLPHVKRSAADNDHRIARHWRRIRLRHEPECPRVGDSQPRIVECDGRWAPCGLECSRNGELAARLRNVGAYGQQTHLARRYFRTSGRVGARIGTRDCAGSYSGRRGSRRRCGAARSYTAGHSWRERGGAACRRRSWRWDASGAANRDARRHHSGYRLQHLRVVRARRNDRLHRPQPSRQRPPTSGTRDGGRQ